MSPEICLKAAAWGSCVEVEGSRELTAAAGGRRVCQGPHRSAGLCLLEMFHIKKVFFFLMKKCFLNGTV